MAKKKSKNVYYIVAAVIIVILVAVFMLRKPADVGSDVPDVPDVETEQEPEVVIPEPTVPTEYVGSILSDAVCVDDEIQATITNTGDLDETIGNKLIVQVNGLVVRAPVCEEMDLAPGESTRCSDMSGPFPIRTGKENLVIVKLKGESSQATVTCD